MRVLDLFSGIGGFALGLERAGMETVAFCEQDKFCQQVLAKHWPDIPLYPDVRKLTGEIVEHDLRPIDIICGGFPCQPYSVAGKQRGADDDRDLWPEMFRLITEVRPRWVFGENVLGFADLPMGLDRVLSDLESEGYDARPFEVPACAVNSPQRRSRIWIVAVANGERSPSESERDLGGVGGKGGQEKGTRDKPTVRAASRRTDVADSERAERGAQPSAGNGKPHGENAGRQEAAGRSGCGGEGDVEHAEGERRRTWGAESEGQQGPSGPDGRGSAREDVAHTEHPRHRARLQPEAVGDRGGQGDVGNAARRFSDGDTKPDDGEQPNARQGQPRGAGRDGDVEHADDAKRPRQRQHSGSPIQVKEAVRPSGGGDVGNPDRQRPQGRDERRERAGEVSPWETSSTIQGRRIPQPRFCRMGDGVSRWVDTPLLTHKVPDRVGRLRSLGNSVVPQVVEMFGWAIMAAERDGEPLEHGLTGL